MTMAKYLLLGTFVGFALFSCSSDVAPSNNDPIEDFTPQQRLLADQIISVFENDDPVIQYGYAENINDGRGITAGRAGFTSATGDMVVVVERYTNVKPNNVLAVYLPRLRELADSVSGATNGLEGLEGAWATAADDVVFRLIQDSIVDEQYFLPALEHAQLNGLTFPLSLMDLYDVCIQHGPGDDPDGLPAIIQRTNTQVGGSPKTGKDERVWLRAFCTIRRSVLLNATDPNTRDAWALSVGRADALTSILDLDNVQMTPPITISPYGTIHTLPK